jgi:hypothetical protein
MDFRTDLIFPVDIKYNLHKDNTPIYQTCNSWADLNQHKCKLISDGYDVVVIKPKFRKWGKEETFQNKKYTINLDTEDNVIELYYSGLGRIGVINDKLELRSTPLSGFNRPIPQYIMFQIKQIFKQLN